MGKVDRLRDRVEHLILPTDRTQSMTLYGQGHSWFSSQRSPIGPPPLVDWSYSQGFVKSHWTFSERSRFEQGRTDGGAGGGSCPWAQQLEGRKYGFSKKIGNFNLRNIHMHSYDIWTVELAVKPNFFFCYSKAIQLKQDLSLVPFVA